MESSSWVGVIVCEQSSQWAAGLRQELAGATLRLLETRHLDDAWRSLAAAPAAFLVAEITAKNAAELLRRSAWFARDFPQARLAIVGARRWASYRWLLQAAGAVHSVFSTRDLGPLAEMARRHAASIPLPPLTVSERIWLSLPWSRNRSDSSPAT